MKKNLLVSGILFISSMISCQKNNHDNISLTASTTTAKIGQAVSLQVTTNASAVNWSVNPPIEVSKLYTITNNKTNIITFSKAGTYIVSVSARDLVLDSTIGKNFDSCWHSHDHEHGHCIHGIDSTSVTISVN